MSHIVKYRSPDGNTDYHHTDDIHDAVSFVEQLRNDQGVDGAQIFRLEEVNFDYRPYYRVQLKASEPSLAAAPAVQPAVAAPAAAPPVAAAPVVAEVPEPAPKAEPAIRTMKPVAEETELVSVPAVTTNPVKEAAKEAAASTSDPSTIGARRGLFGR